MPLKVAVIKQFRKNILHKSRNGAGIKAELLIEFTDKMPRQDHISDTKGRGYGLGKGVQVDHVVAVRECKKGLDRLC